MILAVDPVNPPIAKFVQVSLEAYSGFALDEEGKVYSWGYNGQGHLGHGDTVSRKYAKRIEYFVNNNIQIKEIITCNEIGHNDLSTVFFITTDNHVYGCGDNHEGVLGDGTTTNRYTPIRIGTLENVVQIVYTCGNAGTAYFRTDDGVGNKELWVTGWNAYGQLGVGYTSRVLLPTKIQGYTNVTHVAACGGVNTAGTVTYGSAIFIDSGKAYSACPYPHS
jgi:alpha-tubulin suppressor-like RCC1 family protein